MTVRELRIKLSRHPGEMQVVMSCDAEGNGFSPLDVVQSDLYVPFSNVRGDCIAAEDEAEFSEVTKRVVSLWPRE